jgi:hypothetical protein
VEPFGSATRQPPADKSFGGYIRFIRNKPGFGLRLISAVGFGYAAGIRNGYTTSLEIAAGVLVVVLPLGWWWYRRTGD